MKIQRIAAFSDDDSGGNPAGVVLLDVLPDEPTMQNVAAQVGYSETVFAAPTDHGWRVRYFAPELEVPFCGHATIALGAALALKYGNGIYPLTLNHASITVEGRLEGKTIVVSLQSPATRSEAADPQLVASVLALFSYQREDLDERIPPAIAEAGARHLVLALKTRERLAAMHYDLAAGRLLMDEVKLVTILLAYAETSQLFHTRNPFASGGVYEDPATGAGTAAFAGYLRHLDWPHQGWIDVVQGEDMGCRSRLRAEIPPAMGASIRVSGTARLIEDDLARNGLFPGRTEHSEGGHRGSE